MAETAATEAAGTDHQDGAEGCDYGDGLALPPLDEAAPSLDVSQMQLLSFMNEEICTGNKDSQESSISVEPSVKDNLNCLSQSLSGSMLKDLSDFDTNLSTNHPWGHKTPKERGSATRDLYPLSGKSEKTEPALKGGMVPKAVKGLNNELGLSISKGITNGLGPGRPCYEALKGKPASGGKPTSDCNGVSWNHVVHKATTTDAFSGDKLPNMKFDKTEVNQKLEIAKRKQAYLLYCWLRRALVKKQQTVQVLSFLDLPKAAQVVKGRANQSRAGFQGGCGSQKRRFA